MPPEITLLDIFLLVFIGMGPLKVIVVYIALTKEFSTELRRKVAQKMVFTATTVAIVLLVAGVLIMKLLHFTTGALSIAGGLILLLLALSMVLGSAEKKEQDGPVSQHEALQPARCRQQTPAFQHLPKSMRCERASKSRFLKACVPCFLS